jgi:hypothetical protein
MICFLIRGFLIAEKALSIKEIRGASERFEIENVLEGRKNYK